MKRCTGRCGRRKSVIEFYNDARAKDGKMSRCITCVKESRRASAPENGSSLSEEERRRRSEQAARQHAEGSLGSGAVAKKATEPERISGSIADWLLDQLRGENAHDMLKAIRKGLRSSQSNIALRALENIINMERGQAELQLKSSRHKPLENMSRDELVEAIAEGLSILAEKGDLPASVIEGTFTDITGQPQLPAPS